VRQFESTQLLRNRAGEGAFLVTEQIAFPQLARSSALAPHVR
jgi:hypothetical protein